MISCVFCHKEFTVKGLSGHQYSCELNPLKRKRESPFKGKRHTDDAKLKLSIGAKNQHASGNGVVPNWLGRTHSDESKLKISTALKGNRNGNHRGDRQSFYKDIRMDSSWEVKTAQYLDDNFIDWKYSVHGYTLSDGRVYFPDFFIYENGQLVKLIEVKGYFREANKIKFALFLSDYPDLIVELWDKGVLKNKGIL